MSGEGSGFDALGLELWYGGGFGGPSGPGTYEIKDENYRTCALCVTVYQGCDGYSCDKTFLAYEGTVTISEMGDAGSTLAGTITGLKLREVTIAQDWSSFSPMFAGIDVASPA